MNEAQLRLYRREWGKARGILRQTMTPKEADAERHALHILALGKDKSSILFTNDDLDAVLARFRAISQPANFHGQIALGEMGATRKRWTVRHLVTALELSEADLELLITRRQRAGRLVTATAAGAVTFETVGEADLERVMIDLKKQCRARWPRKGDLLTELRIVRMWHGFDQVAALAAMECEEMPPVEDLDYEALLLVLSAFRKGAKSEIDEPF